MVQSQLYRDVNNKQLFCVEGDICDSNTMTWCRGTQTGIVAEALRSGNMGCSAQECRCGVIIGGSQPGIGDPTVMNNSSMAS